MKEGGENYTLAFYNFTLTVFTITLFMYLVSSKNTTDSSKFKYYLMTRKTTIETSSKLTFIHRHPYVKTTNVQKPGVELLLGE